MEISRLGPSSFRIKTKDAIVIVNPERNSAGKFPKVSADLVTFSGKVDESICQEIGGTAKKEKPFVISGPGEYEVLGVTVFGIATKGNTAYVFNTESMSVVYLGRLTEKLNDQQLTEIEQADVLLTQIDETFTVEKTIEVINQIQPKIIIPMGSGPLDDFLRQMGITEDKHQDKLILTPDKLLQETEVVDLNIKTS